LQKKNNTKVVQAIQPAVQKYDMKKLSLQVNAIKKRLALFDNQQSSLLHDITASLESELSDGMKASLNLHLMGLFEQGINEKFKKTEHEAIFVDLVLVLSDSSIFNVKQKKVLTAYMQKFGQYDEKVLRSTQSISRVVEPF